jgi:hypothetical protein
MEITEIFLLGLDSFIAAIAIAPVLRRKLWIPFAAAFALCDGLGSLAGIAFGVSLGDGVANTVEVALPIALGIYWLAIAIVAAKLQRSERAGRGRLASWPIWLVPVALAADNVGFHLVGHQTVGSVLGTAFGLDAWTSGLLALAGILIGAGATRLVPAMKNRLVSFGVAGGALIAAGGLLFALD